jgi:hypothetical protein
LIFKLCRLNSTFIDYMLENLLAIMDMGGVEPCRSLPLKIKKP